MATKGEPSLYARVRDESAAFASVPVVATCLGVAGGRILLPE